MDFVFIDAPFPAEGGLKELGAEEELDPPLYEWFQFNKDFSEYRNFDECIAVIEDCLTRMGPFDGLLGFSQGAIISAALPGMQAEQSPSPSPNISANSSTAIHQTPGLHSGVLPLPSPVLPLPFQYPFPAPIQQQFYPSSYGNNNRSNRNARYARNQNASQQAPTMYSGMQSGGEMQSSGCQIFGKTNHLAYSCYHRQNLSYRPPGRSGSHNGYPQQVMSGYGPYGTNSGNLGQSSGYGIAPGYGNNAGHGASHGASGFGNPTGSPAQAMCVTHDTMGYYGHAPTYGGYALSTTQAPCYSSQPTQTLPTTPWFFDSGATSHVTHDPSHIQDVVLNSVPKIKFVMLIAGSKFGGSMFSSPKLAQNAFSSPIECPSLHFLGLCYAKWIELLDSFVDPFVIHHPEGHVVPKLDEKGLETMHKFIEKIQKLLLTATHPTENEEDMEMEWCKKVEEESPIAGPPRIWCNRDCATQDMPIGHTHGFLVAAVGVCGSDGYGGPPPGAAVG
ncbi:hypothetical protein Vadar_002022 [Vaccinium darrowii]|uniref:Uncharacterized protein n=1 Tax=Vaccinium darrowii TaxID=229202 RepID=A0ACB7Z135_9ERIC|nr:hypothetical protein Vadar_002022 [Vaccinium darrowii]